MASSARRTSTVPISNPHSAHKSRDKDEPKKEIWSGLLESVSSGKRLPEKTAFVLGMKSFSGFYITTTQANVPLKVVTLQHNETSWNRWNHYHHSRNLEDHKTEPDNVSLLLRIPLPLATLIKMSWTPIKKTLSLVYHTTFFTPHRPLLRRCSNLYLLLHRYRIPQSSYY